MKKSFVQEIPSHLLSAYEEETSRFILGRVRVTCHLGIVLFLLFNLLDRVIYPDLANLFLSLRVASALIHAMILGLTWTDFGERHPTFLGVCAYVSISWMIVVMCLLSGGHRSPFYAGLNLVILGYCVLMPWRIRDAALTSALIYGGYAGSILTLEKIEDIAIFTNNNFFVLCTITISLAASVLWSIYRVNQFLDKEKLKELDKAKSNFLAAISHELKTPMTLIVTPIEQAIAESRGDEVKLRRDEAEGVRRSVYRLSTYVSDLLDVSRGEVGKAQLTASDVVDVKKHFEDLFNSMKHLFEDKEFQAFFQAPEDLKPHFFDIKKIDKVFYNLLNNALKFTPKGGSIGVRLWDEGETLKIVVKDSGIGIPKEKHVSIFERFVQIEEGSTRSYEGMGIGLSLVKDFVEQHGGMVSVASEPGKGSAFTVELPRGKGHFKVPVVEMQEAPPVSEQKLDFTRALVTEAAKKEPEKSSPAHFVKKTILVVDDNAEIRGTIKKVLSRNYQVAEAQNGKEGLEKAKECKPSLIVSDIMMPVMDGYQMVREMQNDEWLKEVPVILLTAKSGTEGLAEGFEAGAYDYLTKPFSPTELRLRVEKQILLRELQADLIRKQNLASIGTLSAGISHNMNTFAGTVDGRLHSISKLMSKYGELPDSLRQLVDRNLEGASEGLQSIKRMIDDLEIYSQKNVEGFKRGNIVETTQAVIDLAKTSLPSNVTLKFQPAGLVVCNYNPHVLNPAILNLIRNSADACKDRPDGEIAVSLLNGENDTVLLSVRDNGCGISLEIRNRVWEPYFTTKDVGSGTGLGLWMVRRAVELDHGGKVWFDSGSSGTTFFVTLPKEGKHGR